MCAEHTLLTPEQLSKCARADEARHAYGGPVPTRNISNGEYLPKPQSALQQRVEKRMTELIDRSAVRLGVESGQFRASDGGIVAGLVAMNDVYGRFFDVSPEALVDEAERAETGIPKDTWIVDDQLHFVRGKLSNPLLRAGAQGTSARGSGWDSNPFNPEGLPDELGRPWATWNPALEGLPIEPECFHLVQFIKDVFLDSQVTVGLISNVTGFVDLQPGDNPTAQPSVAAARDGEILTAEQTAAARDFINDLAGSRRCLAHGLLYTGVGNLDYIEYQIEHHRPDSWKGYTMTNAAKVDHDPRSLMRRWRMDDEDVAYPTYELIAREHARLRDIAPGLNNICVHKGLVPRDTPDEPEMGHPGDVAKACRDWPQLNFIIYHACMKDRMFDHDAYQVIQGAEKGDSAALLNGVPNLAWTTELAQSTAELPNAYAELGTTFGSAVVTFPSVAAHLLGQLLMYMGEDRIVFGSDSVWYGSPQWQLEAFWRFRIPDDIRERWGYPELTERAKRKILGLNSVRLYGLEGTPDAHTAVPSDFEAKISPDLADLMELSPQSKDRLAKIRSSYRDNGPQRTTMPQGWIRTKI